MNVRVCVWRRFGLVLKIPNRKSWKYVVPSISEQSLLEIPFGHILFSAFFSFITKIHMTTNNLCCCLLLYLLFYNLFFSHFHSIFITSTCVHWFVTLFLHRENFLLVMFWWFGCSIWETKKSQCLCKMFEWSVHLWLFKWTLKAFEYCIQSKFNCWHTVFGV